MPHTWVKALESYNYPVYLNRYQRAKQFPGFFNKIIIGDRETTIEFENYFQRMAPNHIEVYFEVVYWKLYSQPNTRNRITNKVVENIQIQKVKPGELWDAIQTFIAYPTISNLQRIRNLLGFKTPVLAVVLTLVSFANPEKFPMIDNRVADWVNSNLDFHNKNRKNKLTKFNKKYTSLQEDDFNNYLNWVEWCREVAEVLTILTKMNWRARDVEMAVFTAQRNKIRLSELP